MDERKNTVVQMAMADLDERIRSKIGDSVKEPDLDPELRDQVPEVPEYLFDVEEMLEPFDEAASKPEAIDFTPESYYQYLTAQVLMPHGGELQKATVTKRKLDKHGMPVGLRNNNPLLDTRTYEVQFRDGLTEKVTANLIAESILSQADEKGRTFAIMKEIVDHRKDGHVLTHDDAYLIDKRGNRQQRMMTKGWSLQVEWRDGTTSWVPLKDLKDSNPIEVAEYAVANKIASEPAFTWCLRSVLRRRDRIIKKVKSKYWSKRHKFGIELPMTVAEALAIDERTGTDFWRRAIKKEMKNVMPEFEFPDDDKVPIGYTEIDCHMIFDVKMDLTRKACYVAGGHQAEPPKKSTYSSVVSRDTVRIPSR
jgi:hypothetical protein